MNKKIKEIIIFTLIILTAINIAYANNTNNTTDTNPITDNSNTQQINTPLKEVKTNTNTQEINITQDNFNTYFNRYGELDYTKLSNNTKLYFHSIPNKTKELIIDADSEEASNMNMEIIGADNFTLNNTSLVIFTSFNKLKISDINLYYNQEYTQNYFFDIERTNNDNPEKYIIENININCTQNVRNSYDYFDDKQVYPLSIKGNNYLLDNITINANIPSSTIPYIGDDDKPHGIALNLEANNITVQNSKINAYEQDKENIQTAYNTLYGVFHKGENFTFTNNTVNITGTEYVYAVIARSSQCNITGNNITAKSISYSAGINVEGTKIKNNIVQNNIINITAGYREKDTTPTTAEDSAYALMLLDYSYKGYTYTPTAQSNNNTTFTNNTIIGDAGNIYAIEIYGGTNTQITQNNIKLTGRTPMGIGAIGENITIEDNNINTIGQTNNTEASADYLKPRTVGIYTYMSNKGIIIEYNNINTTKGRGIYIEQSNNTIITQNKINTTQYDYTIEIIGNNNTIQENQLKSRNHEADNSIKTNNNNNHIQNNTNITTPPLKNTLTINTKINNDNTLTITTTITTNNNTTINKGKITITINGKTIKDENGKIIYAQITNNKATIQYNIPTTLVGKNITLQATYTGSKQCEKLKSQNTTITINKEQPTLTTEDITTNIGSTINLTATITHNDKIINTGKVVFKINGKTVKDNNGKIIYVQITNGIATVNYTIPTSYKAKSYTLTATLISNEYDRLTDTKTLTITA